jgi:DNA excision repair protein ERCC-8
MFVSPVGLTPPERELLFFANEAEVLVMELHEGAGDGVGGCGCGDARGRGEGGEESGYEWYVSFMVR